MTMTHKTRVAKARRSTPTPMVSDAVPPNANIDAARSLFNASLAPMHGVLRFMAQWRETQAGLLHEMDEALGSTLREAESAANVQDLLRLQGELASTNLNRATNAVGALFRTWLETEAALLEQAPQGGADVTRQMIQEARAVSAADGKRAEPNPAASLLHQAQTA